MPQMVTPSLLNFSQKNFVVAEKKAIGLAALSIYCQLLIAQPLMANKALSL
jgi:hypothetical protein